MSKLSQNLLEILNGEVDNDPYVKIFRAHMVILNYHSSYLRRILSTNKKKNDGTLEQIKLSNISPEIFQIILIHNLRETERILLIVSRANFKNVVASHLSIQIMRFLYHWIG